MSTQTFHEVQVHQCETCHKCYKTHQTLRRHMKFECGKMPSFQCHFHGCNYMAKRKDNLRAHIRLLHLREMRMMRDFVKEDYSTGEY
nr:unnamed protein product [Callosobruchus analis]